MNEEQIAYVVHEVLLGLDYLSRAHKIHRDIKAANILLSKSGHVKLADFGATAQLTDTMTKCSTFVGSPYWMVRGKHIPLWLCNSCGVRSPVFTLLRRFMHELTTYPFS